MQENIIHSGPGEFVIRITHPTLTSHTAETHTYPTLAEATATVEEMVVKLRSTGVEEFEIHIINQTTGEVVRRFRSSIRRDVTYEIS